MTTGEVIRKLRKEKGLTQAELAEKSRISLVSVCRYETGARKPSFDALDRISRVLGENVFYLMFPNAEVTSVDDPNTGETISTIVMEESMVAEVKESLKNAALEEKSRSHKRMLKLFDSLNEIGQKEAILFLLDLNDSDIYTRGVNDGSETE